MISKRLVLFILMMQLFIIESIIQSITIPTFNYLYLYCIGLKEDDIEGPG